MQKKLILATMALMSLYGMGKTAEVELMPKKDKTEVAKTDSTKQTSDYEKLIKDCISTNHGMYTVRHIKDDWYFEVPDSLLGRLILTVTRFKEVPQGFKLISGEEVNRSVLYWDKYDDKSLLLREYVKSQFVNEKDQLYPALERSTIDPIIAKFDVAGVNPDTKASLINVTKFLLADNKTCGFTSNDRSILGIGSIAQDRTFMDTIKTYPINTEITTIRTYSMSSGKIPTSKTGSATVMLNTSMVLLPKEPMRPRFADERVGYFNDPFTFFSDEQQKTQSAEIIHRYRLEPKDPVKYSKGILTEPKKQIVYYIDPATPKKWVKYLKADVEDWNVAFEAAGFKNAIVAKEWPDDPSMSLDDARYSVIRYLPSETQNAYGPRIVDPRSGEIIESHVCWYHNVMNLLKKWYMVQCGPLDKRARTMEFDDELMGTLIQFVSSHEIGHSIGLRHNMVASYATPVEKLRDKKWVEANGHTVSIMDYARFNYVAQPEDNISPKGLFPRIGIYDNWAIEWGYKYRPEFKDSFKEKEVMRAETTKRLRNDHRLMYLGDEGKGDDPRSQSEDLGDNSMKASDYGVKNLKRVMENIMEWTKQPDGQYEYLTDIYNSVKGQFVRYTWHVQKNIGRRYTNNLPDQNLFAPYPKDRQKEAIDWFGRNVFTAPLWLYPEEVTSNIRKIDAINEIKETQNSVIQLLISQGMIYKMHASSVFSSEPYPVDEYLNDVFNAVWRPLDNKDERINYFTRQLERIYVGCIKNILCPDQTDKENNTFKRSDAILYVEDHLDDIESFIDKQLNIYTSDDDFNHKHFAYLKREVKGIKKEYYSNDK